MILPIDKNYQTDHIVTFWFLLQFNFLSWKSSCLPVVYHLYLGRELPWLINFYSLWCLRKYDIHLAPATYIEFNLMTVEPISTEEWGMKMWCCSQMASSYLILVSCFNWYLNFKTPPFVLSINHVLLSAYDIGRDIPPPFLIISLYVPVSMPSKSYFA